MISYEHTYMICISSIECADFDCADAEVRIVAMFPICKKTRDPWCQIYFHQPLMDSRGLCHALLVAASTIEASLVAITLRC